MDAWSSRRPQIQIHHPEFDGSVWRTTIPGHRVTAPTIRALLVKLGPGHKVGDYYPNGFPSERLKQCRAEEKNNFRTPSVIMMKPPSVVLAPVVSTPEPIKERRVHPRKVDWNSILDAWEKGMPVPIISERYGISTGYAKSIVELSRREGDPRAVKRRPGRRPLSYTPPVFVNGSPAPPRPTNTIKAKVVRLVWTDEREKRLEILLLAGFSAQQIGNDIGVTRNAVLGKIFRNRHSL